MRSVGSPLEAVAAVAERAALFEAVAAMITAVRPAVVDADVAGSSVVEAVGRDRAHDAAAEDQSQEACGDQLGGSVAGETPDPAGRCRGRGWRDLRGCLGCGWGLGSGGCGLLGGWLRPRRRRRVGGQRGRCLLRCRPGCLRFVLGPIPGRLLRWRRLSLLAHVLNDAPFG
ncbi:hypothetical protein GCM10027200_80760 [Lentzea nigeriaca]